MAALMWKLRLDNMLDECGNIKVSHDSTPLQTWVRATEIFLAESVFCEIATLCCHSTCALFAAVKGLIVSASPPITSDSEYKMGNSIGKVS